MNSTVGTGVATNTLELDAESHMLRDAVLYGLETEPSKKRAKDDATFSAFDNTRFLVQYLSGVEGEEFESCMKVSLQGKALTELKRLDGPVMNEILEKQYPQMVVAPAEGFQVAIQFNIDTYDGDKPAFAHQVALLKHYAMGTHLYKQFQELASGSVSSSAPVEIHHRPNESYWIINADDKVIVAFSMHFVDDDERVVAELVLKGFNFDHKTRSAPNVVFSDAAPAELQSSGIETKEGASDWLTVTYFTVHVQGDDKLFKAVSQAQTLRTFVAYHTKAAKSFMASKMRKQIEDFQKILDRAIPGKDSNKANSTLYAVGAAGKLMQGVKKRRAGKGLS